MSIYTKCPRCNKNKLIIDNEIGEQFCSSCGFVIIDGTSDVVSEKFFPNSTVDPTHIGNGTSLAEFDKGLNTVISSNKKDFSGKPLSASMKSQMDRLTKSDNKSKTHETLDKNLKVAFDKLRIMKEQLSLPDSVHEQAAIIYRKALAKRLTRGRTTIFTLIAVSLFIACRQYGIYRTFNEFETITKIPKNDLYPCLSIVLRELELKLPVVDVVSCITKIANNLKLNEKTTRNALLVIDNAKKMNIHLGKDPMGMAVSVLHIVIQKMNCSVTKSALAETSGISEVTIQSRSKNLKKLLKI